MRKTTHLALAAMFGAAVGFVALPAARAADEPQESHATAQQEQAPPKLPDGFQMKELNQLDNIRDEMATATGAAMDKSNFGKFVDNLAVQDRDRMKNWKDQDFKTLDGVIAQINKDWNEKYHHDFNITDAKNLFTDRYVIVQGVVTNPNVAAANFPVPAEAKGGQAQAAGSKQAGENAEPVEAKDLQKSNGVALVRFPAEHSLPEVTASMVKEGGDWRFVVPDNTTAQDLHTRLQNQLTYLGQHVNQWPADETQAYRMAAHHVMMALYGVNGQEAAQGQK